MRKKKILALALSVALAASPVMYAMAEDEPIQNSADTENTEDSKEIIADKTDENVQIEGQQDSGDDVSAQSSEQGNTERMVTGGYIPSELDYNTPVYNSEGDAARAAVNLPTVYPTNMEWFKSTYPQVRDQNPYGTCWAFSSMGLAEFDLINDSLYDGTGKYNSSIDLSELQLAYFTYNFVQDPLGGTAGDSAKYYKENATVDYLNYGGNYEMASRRLGQWISAVDEAVVPYGNASTVLSNGMDDSYAYNNVNTHLENTYCINIKQNVSDVKQQIMEHGAVGIMYQHAYSGMNYINNTYYDTDTSGGGHAVMIVGWDDTFSKDKFGGTAKPSTDGAWLVRNSWGTGSYNFDYFWLSYDTVSLADTAWVFDFSADDGYDNNYQLDGGISTWSSGYKTVANIYNVSEKEGVSSETLKAVSLSFMHTSEVNYTIEIYTDLKNSNNPATGTKQEVATTTGTTTYAGVYNVPLNSEVELAPGSSFAVVVKTDKASIDYEQSTGIVNENNQMIWDCSVSQANQKSFYGNDYNNFWAWPWGNYCIKAFTSNNLETKYSITYDLKDGTNNSENPDFYTSGNTVITLKDPTRDGCVFEGWYTDSGYTNRITEIPANAAQDYILYAKWASATGESVYAHTISMNGTIGVNFYMELPTELLNKQEAYMEFTLPNGAISQVMVKDAKKNGSYYVFSCEVAAKEMTADITAKMVVGNIHGKVYTYSVKRYADTILKNADKYKSIVIETVKAMLNYGTASQKVFNYRVDDLANEDLSDDDKRVNTVDFSPYASKLTEDASVEGINYEASSLVLNSQTIIRHYFKLEDGYNISDYTFTCKVGDKEIEMNPYPNGSYYYVESENTRAYNLDQNTLVTVRMKDHAEADGTNLEYNAFSYAEHISNLTDKNEKVVDVTKAMYWYWRAAKEYANQN